LIDFTDELFKGNIEHLVNDFEKPPTSKPWRPLRPWREPISGQGIDSRQGRHGIQTSGRFSHLRRSPSLDHHIQLGWPAPLLEDAEEEKEFLAPWTQAIANGTLVVVSPIRATLPPTARPNRERLARLSDLGSSQLAQGPSRHAGSSDRSRRARCLEKNSPMNWKPLGNQ